MLTTKLELTDYFSCEVVEDFKARMLGVAVGNEVHCEETLGRGDRAKNVPTEFSKTRC